MGDFVLEQHRPDCRCPFGRWLAAHRHPAVIVSFAVAWPEGKRLYTGPAHIGCAAKRGAKVVRLVEDSPIAWRCVGCGAFIAPNMRN